MSDSVTTTRDLLRGCAGVIGAVAVTRAMEALRPEVIADDFSAPENDVGLGEMSRAYTIAMASMLATPPHRTARLPELCGPVGVALQAGGLVLRLWAMRSLRGHYAHALRVVHDQPVIRDGPYRLVRHPGYLSALTVWTGAAVSTRNGLAVVVTLVSVGRAYRHRMHAEDALLIRELPGYQDYAATTGRLLPRLAPERLRRVVTCGSCPAVVLGARGAVDIPAAGAPGSTTCPATARDR